MARVRTIVLAAALAALTLPGVATADVLLPGAEIPLHGTTRDESPWLRGPSVSGVLRPFTIRDAQGSVVLSAQLRAVQYAEAPFGRLYSNYRIEHPFTADRSVVRIEFSGFGASSVDVNRRLELTGQIPPSHASRSSDGDTVVFTFTEGVYGGVLSEFFYIYTGATELEFTGTALVVLNTGESTTITGLPVPVLPAPTVVCDGDTNADSAIDFADLNSVLSNFGDGCD